MLQQTTVAAVIPYFERFIARFPTVTDLAAADEHDVLILWQGLGYYSRARNLHKSARQIVAEYDGQFPNDPHSAAKLPGIGRYMVGAILSQAFERRMPIVEANTRRLYARLFAYFDTDLQSKAGVDWLWKTAEKLLPKKRVGDFNQALMELGALVCKPKPLCAQCPLTAECEAYRQGKQDRLPIIGKKKVFTDIRSIALVFESNGKYLLLKRPNSGRWANLWEFPQTECNDKETEVEAAKRLLKNLNLKGTIGGEIAIIAHGVTRFKIRMSCREAKLKAIPLETEELRWLSPDQWSDFPLSSAMRRLGEVLKKPKMKRLF